MITIDHRVVQGEDDPLDPGRIPEFTDIITADPHLTEILSWLPIYADSDLPILLTGEPGTGKELVAMAIFALGPARRRTCQRLNCAALTESLASSELFGHVRGAFTGADHARPGKFRLAHGGSLFLDEVGELPLAIQPKLLRAVEQGEIEPVGGDAAVKVDVRLVAASNQDLLRLIAQGRFRQDLYDRLAVLAIHLPPLAGAPGGHPVAGRPFRPGDGPALWPGPVPPVQRRGPAPPAETGLARKCAGTQERGHPGGVVQRRQPHPGGGSGFYPVSVAAAVKPGPGGGMPASRPSAVQLKELLDSEGETSPPCRAASRSAARPSTAG